MLPSVGGRQSGGAPARVRLPAPRRPEVCVAILAVRNPGLLAETLAALARLGGEVPFEVRLVLNGATDEVVAYARERVRGALVVESPVNLGTAGGYNRAFAASACRWMVTLHDDTEPRAGWLDALVGAARAAPDAGAVGGRVVGLDGRVQEVGRILWREGLTSPPWTGEAPPAEADLPARAVDYHGTVGLLVDRAAWEGVGGFDDGYHPAYHVDTDFCLRLRAAGWRVLVEPGAVAVHHGGASSSSRFAGWLAERNAARLTRRHALALAGHGRYAPDDPAAVAREVARAAGAPLGPRPGAAGAVARALLAERVGRADLDYARREIAVLRDWSVDLLAGERELAALAGARGDWIAVLEAEVARTREALSATAAHVVALAGARAGLEALVAAQREAARVLAAERDAASAAGAAEAAALRASLAERARALEAATRERDALQARSDLLDQALASRWWRLGAHLRSPLDRARGRLMRRR